MICILHGYLLEGSGSNLWTRAVVRALCQAGHDVHLVCQEPRPQDYDFIAAAYAYAPDGAVTAMVDRDTPFAGRCVMHKPILGDTLPVYVRDDYDEFERAVPMIELDDGEIDAYLSANEAVVERVVRDHGITALHANHAVLMSVVAATVSSKTGVPFAIMPHGSAIEYAVKKDTRFHAFASRALGAAARVFVIGKEMRARVLDTFPGLPTLEEKLREVALGVDTAAFAPSPRENREANIDRLTAALEQLKHGRAAGDVEQFRSRLRPDVTKPDLLDAMAPLRAVSDKRPDAGLKERLAGIDWRHDDVVLYVGRLIVGKGAQGLVAALPLILAARPTARLLIVGHGPQREVIDTMVWALEHGAIGLLRNIADWGAALEGAEAEPYETVRQFLDRQERDGTLDRYVEAGRRFVRADRVVFTGYLAHAELRHLLPCADVAVFPSIVKEAGPLVFLEALASGCFPLGTYVGGMAASIDAVAPGMPAEESELMKLRADPSLTVRDIAVKTPAALALRGRHRQNLRDAVVERNDWTHIAGELATELNSMDSDRKSAARESSKKKGTPARVPG